MRCFVPETRNRQDGPVSPTSLHHDPVYGPTPRDAEPMNLLTCHFDRPRLNRFLRMLGEDTRMKVMSVDDLAALLPALDRGLTVAVLPYWSEVPSGEQLELVRQISQLRIPVIPILADGISATVKLEAIKAGAIDCVSESAMEGRLRQLIYLFESRCELIERSVPFCAEPQSDGDLVLCSPAIRQLTHRLQKIAPLSSTVMLTGDTGTGKSTLAKWIHQRSARKNEPFMDTACGSIPFSLVEEEFFGHTRGSFTGAERDHEGKFAVVGKGTLLLDEVDCLPLEVQAKLLRVVEQRSFEKIGSHKTQSFSARLIVATNRPLDDLVAQGLFRADLYYRLGVLAFRVPSLQERSEDIVPMALAFARWFGKENGREVTELSAAVADTLRGYPWPGNVRELRNTMEYAVAFAAGKRIQWSDLPEEIRYPKQHVFPPLSPGVSVVSPSCAESQLSKRPVGNRLMSARQQGERQALLEALRSTNNNRTKAAAALGVSRMTLYKRMERLHITNPRAED